MPTEVRLAYIDYGIMLIYVAFVLGIGFALKRFHEEQHGLFHVGRAIPRGSPAWRLFRPTWAR